MEIIARLPALPADEASARAPGPEISPEIPAASEHSPGVVRPRQQAAARRRETAGAGFPVRSVLVLAALAIVAWSLALKNDAARRHAARIAQAAGETATR